ncbi:MAG: hypothetical protein Q7J98_14625, partial [Kiritimatiellia bacterium]|nr:hypothetical protein [Kiritimatiellia bacterium]
LEYLRHAPIETKCHPRHGDRSCDFPRHSGFYIFDWAFAYGKSPNTEFLVQISRMLDYWWSKRDAQGLLLTESRSPDDDAVFSGVKAPGQTLSLAASLLESAGLLSAQEPAIAEEMSKRANVYIDGFFSAPHDIEKGIFLLSYKEGDDTEFRKAYSKKTNVSPTEAGRMPIWGSAYGIWPACYIALTALCAHRMTKDPRLLQWAQAAGDCYLKQPFPQDKIIPAMDAGLGIELLGDLYDVTGEEKWIKGGLGLAENLINIYLDNDLPRGASGTDWYESQMGPGFLLHGLARIALLAEDRENCPLEADYTAR